MGLWVKRWIFSHGKSSLVRAHGNHSNFVLDRKITTWYFLLVTIPNRCINVFTEQLRCTWWKVAHKRRQSSTPAVRQSAEDDRSAVSTGQLWSSAVFRCCGPVDLEFIPDSLRDPASPSIFSSHLKTHFLCEILTRRTSRITDFF